MFEVRSGGSSIKGSLDLFCNVDDNSRTPCLIPQLAGQMPRPNHVPVFTADIMPLLALPRKICVCKFLVQHQSIISPENGLLDQSQSCAPMLIVHGLLSASIFVPATRCRDLPSFLQFQSRVMTVDITTISTPGASSGSKAYHPLIQFI